VKKLVMMLVTASLLLWAAPRGWASPITSSDPTPNAMPAPSPSAAAEPSPNTPEQDKLAKAKAEEEKGDLDRIHRNYDSAVSHYYAALRINRKDAALYNKIGIAELKLHENGSARKHFSQALKLDPRNFAVLNNLGAVAYIDKKYKNAVNYFKQALALDEMSASSHLNLAEAWMGMGEIDRAMTEYARALELDADIISSSQDGVQARITTPEQRARVSYVIAKSYARRGNLEQALEYLRRAKEGRYPDLAKVYTDKEFAPLWNDPRLAKIIKR
jgi:tetratricopeptide (TPR) repeat protein